MVQKFTLKARSEMYEDVNGDYVKYEDYERLLSVSRSLLGLIADDAVLPNDFVNELVALGVLDD